MVLGLGVDYVDVSRMTAFLERFPERGRARLFTPRERAACDARISAAECYAARFAAKEAFLKALGTGLAAGIRWTEVELLASDDGCPRLEIAGRTRDRLHRMGGSRVLVSLSHDKGAAVAVVVIEGHEAVR